MRCHRRWCLRRIRVYCDREPGRREKGRLEINRFLFSAINFIFSRWGLISFILYVFLFYLDSLHVSSAVLSFLDEIESPDFERLFGDINPFLAILIGLVMVVILLIALVIYLAVKYIFIPVAIYFLAVCAIFLVIGGLSLITRRAMRIFTRAKNKGAPESNSIEKESDSNDPILGKADRSGEKEYF